MIDPTLAPGMKQGNETLPVKAEAGDITSLPSVTAEACQREVVCRRDATVLAADDVVYLVRRECIIFM